MTALLDDADLRVIEVDVLLLERWLSKTQLETLAEQRLLLAARQMRALIDHIKALTTEAPGYVLTSYEDSYPGDENAEARLVIVTDQVYPAVETAQRVARSLTRVGSQPVFALVPVVT